MLMTTNEAALALGITRGRVIQLIIQRGFGMRRGAAWMLSKTEVSRLKKRNRRPGRPKIQKEV